MIISASRRTDIPAFYTKWFINRVRAGYCSVPNPFNHRQVSRVSLRPEDVDVIVFWTRNPRPLFPYLGELDERGYRYFFLYTVMNNPRAIDPGSPSLGAALRTFRELADRIGALKVMWRYDPLFFTTATDVLFHQRSFRYISDALRGYTRKSIVSRASPYRKARRRLELLKGQGIVPVDPNEEDLINLTKGLIATARENGMEIHTCADETGLIDHGIFPGKCVDDVYIQEILGMGVDHRKDPSQRKACGCVASKDIGMYDTCLSGCVYCYATASFELAKRNHGNHDPRSPSLVGHHEMGPPEPSRRQCSLLP